MNARTAHSGSHAATLAFCLLLAVALAATMACCLPQHALAADATAGTGTADTDTSADVDEVVGTASSYDLDIALSTKATSGKKNIVKTVKVTKPTLATTTTTTYASGATSASTKSTAYGLTVKVYVNGVGWKKATLNSAGSAYTYTAAKAGSGKYISAIKITPTSALASAMEAAGLTFAYRAKAKGFGMLSWALPGSTAGTTGNNAALKSLQLKVLSTSAAAKLGTSVPYIGKTTVTLKPVTKGGVLVGLKASVSSNVSGGISYTVYAGSKKATKKNGKKASVGGKALTCVKIKLTGKLAEYYNVCYRTHFTMRKWMKWASNGKLAGTKDTLCTMDKLSVKLVKKNGATPSGGYYTAYSKTSKLVALSGDKTLDGYVYNIYQKKGTNLRTLFNHVVKDYSYIRTYDGYSGSWTKWSIPYAKQMVKNKGGNCYRHAALFTWLARGIGYNAKCRVGYVPRRSGGYAPHGWVEIVQNGTTYCYDPDLAKDHPGRNWYKFRYSNSPTNYYTTGKVRLR